MKDRAKEKRLNRYLENKMEEEEKHLLEADLAADVSLAKDLEESRVAHQVVRAAGRNEMFGKLDAFETEWQASNKQATRQKKPVHLVRWLTAAAAVAILVIGVWWTLHPGNQSPDDLFAENFSTFRTPPILRGENDQITFSTAIEAYTQGKFAQSAQLFAKLKADPIVGKVAGFYQGISLLAMDPPDPAAALITFEAALEADTDFTEAAAWYKALSLLKLNRVVEAREELEKIAREKTYQREAAVELLLRLK